SVATAGQTRPRTARWSIVYGRYGPPLATGPRVTPLGPLATEEGAALDRVPRSRSGAGHDGRDARRCHGRPGPRGGVGEPQGGHGRPPRRGAARGIRRPPAGARLRGRGTRPA